MCEYCEGKKELFNNMMHSIEYYDLYPSMNTTGVKLSIKDNQLVITDPIISHYHNINYCPMCGQRIGGN